jgi:hypothetical protein
VTFQFDPLHTLDAKQRAEEQGAEPVTRIIEVQTALGTTAVQATVVGQLAIHNLVLLNGVDTSRWMLTHVRSGFWFHAFDGGTLYWSLVRLAQLLAPYNFDAYQDGGYKDKAFVASVKKLIRDWDEGRL